MPKLGVVIGRFQVPKLHDAHIHVIKEACRENDKVLILVGCSQLPHSNRDPLDYRTRVKMIEDSLLPGWPQVEGCYPVYDQPDDRVWSRKVDKTIHSLYPFFDVTLYGGRQSFISRYVGDYLTKEVTKFPAGCDKVSGTITRNQIAGPKVSTEDFCRGVIYASQHRYPLTYNTVDVAITRNSKDGKHVLLGTKFSDPGKWRFPGGFIEIDEHPEFAAVREVEEEVGVSITRDTLKLLNVRRMNDWRVRRPDPPLSFLTTFFLYEMSWELSLQVSAGDDLDSIQWFRVADVAEPALADDHRFLYRSLMEYYSA